MPYVFPQRLTGDIYVGFFLQIELPDLLDNIPLRTRIQMDQ